MQSSTTLVTAMAETRAEAALGRVLPYLVWPGLLGLSTAYIALARATGLDTGLVYFSAFLLALLSMGLVEAVTPYRRDWQPSRRDWLSNTAYFTINGLTSNLANILAALIAVRLAPADTALPLWAAVPLAVLVSTFFGYWWHRLGHTWGWLWRLHGVHHVPGKLFMFNNNTVHAFDLLVGTVVSTLPLLVLGFSSEAIAIAAFFGSFQNFFAHINVDVRLGRLGLFVMGPEHHRFHHSVRIEEAGNFSSQIALWDRLFGTFVYRPGQDPVRIGIAKPHDFPAPDRLLASLLHPLRGRQTRT